MLHQYLSLSFFFFSAVLSLPHELTWEYLHSQTKLSAVQEWYIVQCKVITQHNKPLQTDSEPCWHCRVKSVCVDSPWFIPVHLQPKHYKVVGGNILLMCLLFCSSLSPFSSSGNNIHIWTRRWTDHIHMATERPSQHAGRQASHWLQHTSEGRRPGEGGQLLWSRRLLEAPHCEWRVSLMTNYRV